MKTIGIAAHSSEGGALCFLTACREGAARLGPHRHPPVVVSALPMGWSMEAWESGDSETVGRHLARGVQLVADAGAEFFVCPDNTAHLVLDEIIDNLPIPGLHIADVVCDEIRSQGWSKVGLLGTKWTMTGSVYEQAIQSRGWQRLIPGEAVRRRLNEAIFEELCQGVFREETTREFVQAIEELRSAGAECVILGCTEIPLIIHADNSPLPILDSTRLLAKHAVHRALDDQPLPIAQGWLREGEPLPRG